VNQNDLTDNKISNISWHPGFIGAIHLELNAYKDALEFYPEYQLTSEPLRIDCVIIKKTKDVEIKKNIAAIFRTWNLLEYKSPTDYVSVEDFYKVYGYACLYASFKNAPMTDMTITFIESHHPIKLLDHLRKERRYTVEENGNGIYTVNGDILPIQIINSRNLSAEENLWLNGLSNCLGVDASNQMFEEAFRQEKSPYLSAYLDTVIRANPITMREVMKMSGNSLTIEQVLEEAGWISKWKAEGKTEGKTEGRTEGKAEVAKNMIALGLPFETIVCATQLEPEKVKALYQNQ